MCVAHASACTHVYASLYTGLGVGMGGGVMFDDRFVYVNITCFDVKSFMKYITRAHLRKSILRSHCDYYYAKQLSVSLKHRTTTSFKACMLLKANWAINSRQD